MSSRLPKKGKKTPQRRSAVNSKWPARQAHSATKTSTRVAPDELDVKLMFRKIGTVQSTVSSLGVVELKPNDAYDVDPTLGSTETYGFDEYAALYSYYRVIGYSYIITVVNNSGIGSDAPIMMYVTNTNTRVSTSGSRWDLYSTNPHCQSKLLALPYANGSLHTIRGSFAVARILGSGVVETDDAYRSLTTASPTDLVWLGLACENITGGLTINFCYNIQLTMNVRFYAREVDLSLSALAARVNAHLAARASRDLKKKVLADMAKNPVA